MDDVKKNRAIRILTAFTFLVMVVVNALANILPLNGITTAEVSDSYQNLFAPAGLTFAIWGVIYILLAVYTVTQIIAKAKAGGEARTRLLNRIGIIFSVSSLANAAWIFSWHYQMIPVSMLLMTVILICLYLIRRMIRNVRLSAGEKFWIQVPFSIYFGWITVATIANATALLVSLQFSGFGLAEPVWTIIVLGAGLVIGLAVMLANRDLFYGLVLLWAYAGILVKHLSPDGFNGQYPAIIAAVIVCLVGFLACELSLLIPRKFKNA